MYFVALAPEINVGLLMSGAGPAPATAAAAAWASVAASVSARSAFLQSLLPRLAASWQAPETALMTRNVAIYLAHNEALRTQALLASTRHTKQAADYSAALAGMAQIPEIVANHVTHAVLQATNFLGVNTAAIAANEAQYAAMWAQNAGMMTTYLANSTANMTFEPFLPPKPLATSIGVPIPAAAAGAASVGDAVVTKMTLAAQGAQAVASMLEMRVAGGALVGTKLGQTVAAQAQRLEQAASNAATAASQSRENQAARPTTGQQLGHSLVQQQLGGGVAAGAGGAAVGIAFSGGGQALQTGAGVGTATGGGVVYQPMSALLANVNPENRTGSVGYFGARPGSPTLERMSRGEQAHRSASALRPESSSAALPQVAAPANWETGGLTVAPPPPPVPRVAAEPLRPILPTGTSAPVTRSKGKQRERIVVPDTAAMPIYQDSAPEYESVPVDVPSSGEGR
ncbi:PPE family protein [Tsukamurella paurometabola]|uniref:PPE family protein n=1 Tax=Tsukamurella paurometabola TaxID=2061 RepID=A0ABS5N6M0_TSUPA|nr:PPE family protein [Tsukamurella paurometabola]MBS4099915.1 PPE family protein [Tsukamurella paurometabola]